MESVKIPFAGINRSIDDGISVDGQSMELINARIKNSSVEPIGNPVHVATFDFPVKRIYYHSLVNKIIAFSNSGDIYALDNDYTNKTLLSSELRNSSHVEFIGNMACFFKGGNILYLLHGVNGYEYIGNIPELPQLIINQSVKVVNICPDHKFLGGRKSEELTVEEFTQSARYVAAGYLDNCIDSLNREKYMIQPCLIKYAFRTTSGKYIKESPVIIVEHTQMVRHDFKFDGVTGDTTPGAWTFLSQSAPLDIGKDDYSNSTFKAYYHAFAALGTKLDMSFPQSINLSYLKSLITSIEVFISPIEWHTKKDKKYNSITYTEYESNDYKSQLLKAYKFYKVAEFSLDGEKIWELENWSKDNLAIQEQLVTTEIKHQFSAKTSYVYNSRLHLANISYTMFDGYGYGYDSFTQEEGDNELYTAIIFTHINTEQGEYVTRKRVEIKGRLAPFLTYPDSRAIKMEVYVTKNYTGNPDHLFYKRTFHLTKHPHLNLAYYYYDVGNAPKNRGYYIPPIYGEGSAVILPLSLMDEAEPYISENTLKVSDLNNPISFLAVQTYQPSTKKIIGLCSNTTALSQGQFGQHPLYVFAEDGVYAMSVGTEGVVYSTQTPVTRDVCINSKSIKGIDQAVIFASQRGLMMIVGNATKLLSGDLDGHLPSCIESSPIIRKIANIGNFELSSVVFNDYIRGAEVGYNYRENEIIVANPDHEYAYVYNVSTGSWGKISHKIISFTNKYPECYALISRGGRLSVHDIQNDHRGISKILLLSKPIKMGNNSHKRILQTALRGIVKRSMSDLYLRGEPVMFRGGDVDIFSDVGLYILGSNDAEHFSLISGKESIVDIRDLVTKMNKSKPYKYFMVALVGGVRTDVSLNYMELVVSEAFDNRLR